MTIDYEIAGTEALDAAMVVMACAFDPSFGEAWNRAQCSGVLALPGAALIVARAGGAPLGFALVRTIVGEAELLLIAVRPEARGDGVGRGLLEQTMTLARSKGAERLFLEVRRDNAAIVLYEQLGFRRVGVRVNYYRGSDGRLRDAMTFSLVLA